MSELPAAPPVRKFKPSQGNVPKNYYGDINNLKVAIGNDVILAELEKWTKSPGESSGDNNNNGQIDGEGKEKDKFPETYDELIEIEVPDTNIGEGVDITGELQFKRLLRVDGVFKGSLTSSGNIVVGKSGTITGDLLQIDTVVVNGGKIIGNLVVESLVVKNGGTIVGDISCKTMKVLGTNCLIRGRINVHSLSPEIIDESGDILFRKEDLNNLNDDLYSGDAGLDGGEEYEANDDRFDSNEAKFVWSSNDRSNIDEGTHVDSKTERERLIAEKRAKKIALSKQVEDSFRSMHTNSN